MASPLAVRDPIHGWIKFSYEERCLIDSPLVQRLRHIGQLTSVNLVYPGGNNTRFEHSLGAMHLASMYADVILESTLFVPLEPEEKVKLKQLLRVAALLHDIGHGPFSHSFDRTVYKKIYPTLDTQKEKKEKKEKKMDGHDLHRHYILQKDEKIRDAIHKLDIEPLMVCNVWNGAPDPNTPTQFDDFYEVLSATVQGPLGADRMDFMMRDSYYTGTSHLGTIAHTRIIDHAWINDFRTSPHTDAPLSKVALDLVQSRKMSLVYSEKILGDATHALNGRQYLYANVYLHKTSVAGSILIEKILDSLPGLMDRTRDLEQFVFLNDMVIQEALHDPQLNHIAKRLLLRDLPKLVYQCQYVSEPTDIEKGIIDSYKYPSFITVYSRSIVGMEAAAFDKYGILFEAHDGDLYTCSERLTGLGFQTQQPYHIARVYSLQPTHTS